MKRFQLIEIEDQAWLPTSVRDALTDYLQFMTETDKALFADHSAARTRRRTDRSQTDNRPLLRRRGSVVFSANRFAAHCFDQSNADR